MGNKTKWFIAGLGVIIIILSVLIIYNARKTDTHYFNKIEIPKTHYIYNRTDVKYLDTIISAGLSVLKIEPTTILIQPLKKNITFESEFGDFTLEAYIIGDVTPFGTQYVIYVNELSRNEYIRVLSHELIHLIQYETGTLKMTNGNITWHNKIYSADNIPKYSDREWEQDAFILGRIMEDAIKKILIPKNNDK